MDLTADIRRKSCGRAICADTDNGHFRLKQERIAAHDVLRHDQPNAGNGFDNCLHQKLIIEFRG